MADDSVSIKVTADVSSLQSQFRAAEDESKRLAAELKSLQGAMQGLGGSAQSQIQAEIDKTTASMNAAKTQAAELAEQVKAASAAETVATASAGEAAAAQGTMAAATKVNAGVFREFAVLVDEAGRGAFTRMPGSLLVMANRMNLLTPATLGLAGAIGVLGFSLYEIIKSFEDWQRDIHGLQGDIAFLGRSAQTSFDAVAGSLKQTERVFDVSADTAKKMMEAVQAIGSITDTDRVKIEAWGGALAKIGVDGGDAAKATEQLARVIDGSSEEMQKFALAHRGLFSDTEMQAILASNNQLQTQRALISGLDSSLDLLVSKWERVNTNQNKARGSNTPGPQSTDVADNPNPQVAASYEKIQQEIADTKQAVSDFIPAANAGATQIAETYVGMWQKVVNDAKQAGVDQTVAGTEAAKELKRVTAELNRDELEDQKKTNQQTMIADQEAVIATVEGSKERIAAIQTEMADAARLYRVDSTEYKSAQSQMEEAKREQSRLAAQEAKKEAEAVITADKETVAEAAKGSDARIAAAQREVDDAKRLFAQLPTAYKSAMDEMRSAQEEQAAEYTKIVNEQYAAVLREDQLATEATKAGSKERLAAVQQEVDDAIFLYGKESQQVISAQKRMTQAQGELLNQEKKDWEQYSNEADRTFNQSLLSMERGRQSWKQMEHQALVNVANFAIEQSFAALTKFVADRAAEAAASQAADAIKTSSAQSASDSSLGSWAASAIKQITGDAGTAASGSYSALASIPYVGPFLGAAAAAAALASVLGFKSLVSSEGGLYEVPGEIGAILHPQETVMPASVAGPMRSFFEGGGTGGGGGGGGIGISLNVSAVDARGFQTFVNQPAVITMLARRITQQVSTNPSLGQTGP